MKGKILLGLFLVTLLVSIIDIFVPVGEIYFESVQIALMAASALYGGLGK